MLEKANKLGKKDSTHKLTLSLINKTSDIIGHVTSLLSPVSLVAVVMHLLQVGGEEVQGKALKIVADKLEQGKKYFSSDQVMKYMYMTYFWWQCVIARFISICR